jgi:2,4-dienoyl-CoA reductase (NADPH2)
MTGNPMQLLAPLTLGPRTARNRVMFGPHVTNLGSVAREFTGRHVAYYQRRARGGCGTIVVEGASVHPLDWPYERAPLASRAEAGWAAIAAALHEHDTLAIASLDHAGGQGSSAYSQRELWAPSRVPEVNTREVPKWMEAEDIAEVIGGFGTAAAAAVAAGCDGVEINAGQHSLVRQFLSALTNHRDDEWGTDRLLFARQVIEAVVAAAPGAVVGLRLCCDELAPWAGITPAMAPAIAADLCAAGVDYLVVVRGSIYSVEKTRPDFHEPPAFNVDVCRAVRVACAPTAVFLQGSVVDPALAEWAIADGVCDAVEMTRAQVADPDLVAKLATGEAARIRPCLRCNQTCQVRDPRSPVVTCVVEPSSGHETDDPDWYAPAADARDVLVVGGGWGGMAAARGAARRGHRVRVVERSARVGGVAAVAGPAGPLVAWLAAELNQAGVEVLTGADHTAARQGEVLVQATGGQPGLRSYQIEPGAVVFDAVEVLDGSAQLPDGPVALFDPIGGPIAVGLAERLAARAILITADQIAGNELARTGDLAPANVRLQRSGVRIERRTLLRVVRAHEVEVEDRFSGERRTIACAALVDCGYRLPTDALPAAAVQIGDCVAPRTVLEAVLEARRAALAL